MFLKSLILLACLLNLLSSASAAPKPKILTTVLPVFCFATEVAGADATVQNLLPPDAEPHEYQLTPRDLRALEGADLVLTVGLGLDCWLEHAVGKSKKTIPVTAGLDSFLIHHPTGLKTAGTNAGEAVTLDEPNPHFWLDPDLACHAVTNILRALRQAAPGRAAAFEANAARYVARLQALDADYRRSLTPLAGVPFVTQHDAFPYLARRYGLNLVGVIEMIPDVEPTPRHLQALREVTRREKVRVLFTEPQLSPRLVRQLARDWKLEVAELDPLETGPLRSQAFEEGLRRNLRTLERELKPRAP